MKTPLLPRDSDELVGLVKELRSSGVVQVSIKDGDREVTLVLTPERQGLPTGVQIDEFGIHTKEGE